MLRVNYENTELRIFSLSKEVEFDINKDLDIKVLKKAFNDSIAALSLENNHLSYWLMRLSERNTLVNNAFLDFCYIKLIEQFYFKKRGFRGPYK